LNGIGETKTSERLLLIGELSSNVNNNCCNEYGASLANRRTKIEKRIDSSLEKENNIA